MALAGTQPEEEARIGPWTFAVSPPRDASSDGRWLTLTVIGSRSIRQMPCERDGSTFAQRGHDGPVFDRRPAG